MKIQQLKKVMLPIAKAHRDNKVSKRFATNVIGEAGIGKTEGTRDVATELGMAYINVRVGQLEQGDLTGYPMKETIHGSTVMKYAIPNFLPQYKRNENGSIMEVYDEEEKMSRKVIDFERMGDIVQNIDDLLERFGGDYTKIKGAVLHFDEINRIAGDDTKQAIFQLPEQYRIHTYKVPDGCVIFTSANPDSNDYQVAENLSERAFMDRFLHLVLEPDLADWMVWAQKKELHPGLISFYNADPNALFERGDNILHNLNVKPSPRSAHLLHILLTEIELPSEDSILREVFAGVVGMEYANNLANHLKENMEKVITGEELVKSYKKFRKFVQSAAEKNRIDYLDQVTRNLYVFLQEESNHKKHKIADNIENIEEFLKDLPADMRMTLVQQLVQFDHVNELLGASDVVFETLNADAMRAQSRK